MQIVHIHTSAHTKVHILKYTQVHKNIMFLSDLKPLFDKFNSINNIDSESAMKIADECLAICKSLKKQFKIDSDICCKLRYLFGILYFLLMKNNKFCEPATSRDIKSVLLDKIDMRKEILLNRLKNKTKIGILDELPNHIIDSIYKKIIE